MRFIPAVPPVQSSALISLDKDSPKGWIVQFRIEALSSHAKIAVDCITSTTGRWRRMHLRKGQYGAARQFHAKF